MKMSISLTLMCVLLVGASPATKPAAPATQPSFKLTDKQIVAGYDVKLKTGKTRDGKPFRAATLKEKDGSMLPLAIVGPEGHPILVVVPEMTLVPGAFEGNEGTLKLARTIFCNVVNVEGEEALFKRMLRDLMDAKRNQMNDVTRDYGDVHVVLEFSPAENNSNYIDISMTMTPKVN